MWRRERTPAACSLLLLPPGPLAVLPVALCLWLCGLFVVRVDLSRKASSSVLTFMGVSLWSLGTDLKNFLGSSFLCYLCYQFWDTFSISKYFPIDPFRLFSLELFHADLPHLWLKLLPILHHLWLYLLSDIFILILGWKCCPFVWLPQTSCVFYDLHFSLSYPRLSNFFVSLG